MTVRIIFHASDSLCFIDFSLVKNDVSTAMSVICAEELSTFKVFFCNLPISNRGFKIFKLLLGNYLFMVVILCVDKLFKITPLCL